MGVAVVLGAAGAVVSPNVGIAGRVGRARVLPLSCVEEWAADVMVPRGGEVGPLDGSRVSPMSMAVSSVLSAASPKAGGQYPAAW